MAGGRSTVARATFHLPLEIAIEILSRLPVKSLLRFKSVCKTWYELMKAPDFISKHLQTQVTLNSTSLLVTTYNGKTKNFAVSFLPNDGFSGPIDSPFFTVENYHNIGGICNGLVCISPYRYGYNMILCNPSTRQFREIPKCAYEYEFRRIMMVSVGFGFHPSAHDYKLIKIVLYSIPIRKYNVRADLYVMSTGTWREIDVNKLSSFFGEMNELGESDNIVVIDDFSASAVLNGVFYWPARILGTYKAVVMSFDMGNEVFRKIKTPECLDGTWDQIYRRFTELDDKLALVVSPDERGFDVWVLNENENSWTNQVKGASFPRIASDTRNRERTVVVGGKNGELLVTKHKVSGDLKLFSYDTRTRQTKDLWFGHIHYKSRVYLYAGTGTLVPAMQANEVSLN
ncbi:hypothetical protein RHMOL_Rhmol05G0291000 [Rhododendron molle]|uniref:Uncharacterized protein n=1 Tax=Rhododendron molle TaxID=49168 RepID=A0ACC0NWI9_RHOML|nr:hypothetical protein RHMOL_Rhmol05G0291000 [Rhododendron molle]